MKLFAAQHLAQKQSLVITAQLQQAIHLLRMTNAELEDFIEKQTVDNPFMDVARSGSDAGKSRREATISQRSGPDFAARAAGGSDDFDLIASLASAPKPSLYAHVTQEIERMFENARDRVLAGAFLDALEPSGWLSETVEEISTKAMVSLDDAEEMLAKLQTIEPAGLFARGLSDCLMLQAKDKGILSKSFECLLGNLPKLAAGELKELTRICACSHEELLEMMAALRGLNPKPGTEFDGDDAPIRAPDLLVRKGDDGAWIVDFNRSTLASVVIRADEAKELAGKNAEAAKFVNEKIAEAKHLDRAVKHRNLTTLRVGAEVMRRQKAFLEHGPSHIVPMVLREVADELDVHESTVSRITAGLLIATPIGTFPLKMFFSASLPVNRAGADQGGSAASVRHRIQKIVENEPADAPYSDDAIAQMVSDDGVFLARRTVAKYRDMLNIPSSFQRRRRNKVLGLVA